MKKAYVKPSMESEAFVPQTYVAACYEFDAMFYCSLGSKYPGGGSYESNGLQHGSPCAETTVHIDGNYRISGWEHNKPVQIDRGSVDLNGFDLTTARAGDRIPFVEWTSFDDATYHHHGYGLITSEIEELPGRPNHS